MTLIALSSDRGRLETNEHVLEDCGVIMSGRDRLVRPVKLGVEERLTLLLTDGKVDWLMEKAPADQLEFDPRLMAEASTFFHQNMFSLFTSMMSGLMSLMSFPEIVSVLHGTGKSASKIGAFNRYLTTINHVLEWYKVKYSAVLPYERRQGIAVTCSLYSFRPPLVSARPFPWSMACTDATTDSLVASPSSIWW